MMAKFARADGLASPEKISHWEATFSAADGQRERAPSGDVQGIERMRLLYGVARCRSGIASTFQFA